MATSAGSDACGPTTMLGTWITRIPGGASVSSRRLRMPSGFPMPPAHSKLPAPLCPLSPLTVVVGDPPGDRNAAAGRSGVLGGMTGTGGVGALTGRTVTGSGVVRVAPVVGRRTTAGFVPALPVDTRGDRARRGLTTPARMGVQLRDAAALALPGPVLALLPLRAISGRVSSEGSLMWMTGVSFGFMIPVVTLVLLASPVRSGSGDTSLRPGGWRALLAILAPTVEPLRCFGPVGPAASLATGSPTAVWVSRNSLPSGPPFRGAVIRLGPHHPTPSLGWEGGTGGPRALGPPVVATPMEW